MNFKAYLRNSGDADLTNMQYQVTVYTDVGGTRGDVAKIQAVMIWLGTMLTQYVATPAACQETSVTAGDFVGGAN